MKNLINMGFSKEFIDELIDMIGYDRVDVLDTKYENTYKIYLLLQELSGEDAKYYLMYFPDLFIKNYDKMKTIIYNADISDLKANIKGDINYLPDFLLDRL